MKIIRYILTVFIAILISNFSMAQEHDTETVIAFIVPQYLITNAIRVDIDFRKQGSNKWWVISPYYYSDGSDNSILNRNNSDFNQNKYESMYGVGIGVSRKMFLKSDATAKGFYTTVGLTYKYFSIQGDNYTYMETTGDDGLTYYQMADLVYTININSYSGSIIIGHQFNPLPKFYIDMFIGFGLKYSTHDSPEKVAITYNRGSIDYGYSGTQFIGGLRLGIAL